MAGRRCTWPRTSATATRWTRCWRRRPTSPRARRRAEARIISRLLARGADVNARAAGNHTALHEAAFRGNLALAELLLAHGADATARNDDGHTALDIAQAKGHAALTRRLRGELP